LSNYAFFSATVDCNSIPLAAIERVEILKDGASSIYGTDAIAGVVNFITRKDFSGVEVSGQAGVTQHGGGDHYQATVTAGWGDLTKDRFNAFVTVDWQKDTRLAADEPVAFPLPGYPARSQDWTATNPHSSPANIAPRGLDQSRVRRGVRAAGLAASSRAAVLATPYLRVRRASVTDIVSAGRAMDGDRPRDVAALRRTISCSPSTSTRETRCSSACQPTPSVFFFTPRLHAGALPGNGSVLSGGVRRGQRPVRTAQPVLSERFRSDRAAERSDDRSAAHCRGAHRVRSANGRTVPPTTTASTGRTTRTRVGTY
jgi:hypothetical protein